MLESNSWRVSEYNIKTLIREYYILNYKYK
jgi:hypothetical protein